MAGDHYETLGVPRTASSDEIQRAFRALARRYHPDVNKDPSAEERFKEINEAYSTLSDPDQRRRYDRYGPGFRQVQEGAGRGARATAGAGGRRAGAGRRAGRSTGGGGDWVDIDLDDLGGADIGGGFGEIDIEDLFSGLFRRGRGGGGPIPGADQEVEIEITVEDAYRETRRQLLLSGPDGQRTVDVTIPAGVTDGTRLRVAGEGGRGGGGAAAGDLHVIVRIARHPRFRVTGRNVHVDLLLTPWEAALGATVPVATPRGEATLKVPPGSSTGRRLRLRGEGLPHPSGSPGHLNAEVKIMVPKRLTPREHELFSQLAAASDFDPRRG